MSSYFSIIGRFIILGTKYSQLGFSERRKQPVHWGIKILTLKFSAAESVFSLKGIEKLKLY